MGETYVGYGRTYEDALANARAQAADAAEMRAYGNVIAMFIVAIFIYLYSLICAAFRPVSGTAFLALGMGVPVAFVKVVEYAAGPDAIVGLILAVLAALGWMAFWGVHARRTISFIEIGESELLFRLFTKQPLLGRLVHILLYAYTAVFSVWMIWAILMIGYVEAYLGGRYALSKSFGLAPFWIYATTLAVGGCAVAWRYFGHPFTKCLTLTGALRERRSAPEEGEGSKEAISDNTQAAAP